MAEGNSGTRLQITIAVIGLVGVLGAAVISNWDKVFPATSSGETHDTGAAKPAGSTEAAGTVPYVDRYVGLWKNENPQTDGVTRVEISDRLGQLSLHEWGRCHPTDCDNGTHPLMIDGNAVRFDFVENTISNRGTLTVLADGKLQMAVHTHFNDTSGRPDYDSVFRFVQS